LEHLLIIGLAKLTKKRKPMINMNKLVMYNLNSVYPELQYESLLLTSEEACLLTAMVAVALFFHDKDRIDRMVHSLADSIRKPTLAELIPIIDHLFFLSGVIVIILTGIVH
jgi:hypothetical protein